VDLQVDYALDLGNSLGLFGPASMNFQLFASWALENEKVGQPGQPGIDCLGFFGSSCSGFNVFMQPDVKYVFNWDYITGDLASRFQWRAIPSLSLFPTANNPIKDIPGVNYIDLNFDYTFADRYTLFLGMDNILDDEPPIVGFSLAGDANVDISLYDTYGRRYYGGIRVRL
jgi:outer membrane receptor protein involved in Fe transport